MWPNALAPSFLLGKNYSSPKIQQMTRNVLDVLSGRTALPDSGSACTGSLPLAMEAAVDLLLQDDRSDF